MVVGRDLDDEVVDGELPERGAGPAGVAGVAVRRRLGHLGGQQLHAGGPVDHRHLDLDLREDVDRGRDQHMADHVADEGGASHRATQGQGEKDEAERGHARPPVGAWRRDAASGSLLNCWCKRPD